MPSVFTLEGHSRSRKRGRKGLFGLGLGNSNDKCRCVYNPRTKRSTKLCPVSKSKSRTGWKFVKGGCR